MAKKNVKQEPVEIQINQFQLSILLDDKLKEGYNFLLQKGVNCNHCGGICPNGATVNEIYLTKLNDIMIVGTCNTCNGKVVRIMEFGEDKAFYEKANQFRKAIGN